METLSFQVSKRVVLGKKVKELRRQGLTPLHLYGKGADLDTPEKQNPSRVFPHTPKLIPTPPPPQGGP